MHKLAMFLLLFTLNISAVLAQSSTVSSASTSIQSTSATASSSLATIAPGSQSYTYLGCYNETTGLANAGNVRALGELGNLVRATSHPHLHRMPSERARRPPATR